jgi:predicted acylesterase/phospholipase RssA
MSISSISSSITTLNSNENQATDRAPYGAPFKRCLTMAGGGFRFAYYLGIYESLRLANKPVDVIVASCGAAIAASLIHQLPDHESRVAWLCSKEMHAFYLGLKSNTSKRMTAVLYAMLARAASRSGVKNYPDLWNDYLFAIPDYLPLPSSAIQYDGAPALAIIAGRILFEPKQANQPMLQGAPALFQETVFANQSIAQLLHGIPSSVHRDKIKHSVVASYIECVHGVPLVDAVRASISDMYYFPCHTIRNKNEVQHFLGGVVDLFPIEIARRLATELVMEVKAPYDFLMGNPAVRSVLGFDGNARLQQVMAQSAELWVDTRRMETDLVKYQISKRMDVLRNQILLSVPQRYEDYVLGIEMQVAFGTRCAQQALKKHKS